MPTDPSNRESFIAYVSGPYLSSKFIVKLRDGWYVVTRRPTHYHAVPVEGWRVWWWRFVCHLIGIWWGFGSIAQAPLSRSRLNPSPVPSIHPGEKRSPGTS